MLKQYQTYSLTYAATKAISPVIRGESQYYMTLTGNLAITIANGMKGDTAIFYFTCDSTSRVVTFSTGFTTGGIMALSPSLVSVIGFTYIGSTWKENYRMVGNTLGGTSSELNILNGEFEGTPASSLSKNADIIRVASYGIDAQSGAGAWGRNYSNSYREFVTIGNKHRIRQTGSITQIKIYCADNTGLAGFYIKIWRKDGTTYDLVGTSDDLVAGFTAGAGVKTITLASPIAVQEGDYVGYRLETAEGNSVYHLRSITDTGTTSYYVTDATPSATDYAWASQSASADTSCPIEIYMAAPLMIGIGDSLMAGHTAHYSFCEATATTSIASSIMGQIGGSHTYQNMGIGSQTTTTMSARFTTDVVNLKPKIAIIQGGINDITGGTITLATFITNMTAMLTLCTANAIIPVVFKILPCTAGSTAQMQKRDLWNASLTTLCQSYPTAILIDAGVEVGLFRAGGDAGNLWDIQVAYNADDTHYNAAGYGVLAGIIKRQIDSLPSWYAETTATVVSDTSPHTGTTCLKLTAVSTVVGAKQAITLVSGTSYAISVYAKATSGDTACLYVDSGNGTPVLIGSTTSTTWKRIKGTFIATGVNGVVYFRGLAAGDIVWFDSAE